MVLWCALGAMASSTTEDDQVLVFRNTGEVNLFFAHELDSIVLSGYDADSLLHEDMVSQVFYTPDTAYIIPICEIDSVAFGSRNAIALQPETRLMSAEDSLWIIRYEGNHIYYKAHTPADILPKKGDKLFYGKMDALFPQGLVARVGEVVLQNGEYQVTVSDVELKEVFRHLFYAGSMVIAPQGKRSKAKVPLAAFDHTVDIEFHVSDLLIVEGTSDVSLSGNVVVNPLIGYYYLEGDIRNSLEVSLKGKIEDTSKTFSLKSEKIRIPFGTYGLVFTPQFYMNAFLDLEAELSADLRTARYLTHRVKFIKRKDQDPIFEMTPLPSEEGKMSSQVDLLCSGEIFLGIEMGIDFNILQLAGSRLNLKGGPSLQGELGIGALQRMSASKDYLPELYSAAKLSTCLKIGGEATIYARTSIWGEEENERTLGSWDVSFNKKEIDLFPHFFQTRAVRDVTKKIPEDLSMATKSDNEILTDVEAGFEIVDMDGQVLDSVFVDSLMAGTGKVQGMADSLKLKVEDAENNDLRVRPVFHYAGHTVRAECVNVMSDANLQPMVFAFSNGPVSVLSSYPFIGHAKKGDTFYQVGGYLPRPITDSVFDVKPRIFQSVFIDEAKENFLLGVWQGREGDADVQYTFEEDGSGTYWKTSGEVPFTYALNTPQSGRISIYWKGGNETKVLFCTSVEETRLYYRTSPDSEAYVLEKIQ